MNPERQSVLVGAIALAAIVTLAANAPNAQSDDAADRKVREASSQSAKAAKAFDTIMQDPDKAIPPELLAKAKAVAVFPQVIKVAFAVGGEGGRGVVSRHVDGGWSKPVFYRAHAGSVGPQIGASATDFVLLLMNDESLQALMKKSFEIGGEVSATAGPVGRYKGAATDAVMDAKILSYSRSKGLFAGVNLKGVVVKPEDDLNTAVYDRTAREILSDADAAEAAKTAGLKAFPQTLGRYSLIASDQQ